MHQLLTMHIFDISNILFRMNFPRMVHFKINIIVSKFSLDYASCSFGDTARNLPRFYPERDDRNNYFAMFPAARHERRQVAGFEKGSSLQKWQVNTLRIVCALNFRRHAKPWGALIMRES